MPAKVPIGDITLSFHRLDQTETNNDSSEWRTYGSEEPSAFQAIADIRRTHQVTEN
ncbi:hypothetical protein [Pontixanthobacter gangjinensis]|uniref:Uncharacterized protein n=1 Tax=Pontixanthobacter gangjinensis TaxID=1028742 RepID=A0A6I4SNQ0_9SPHN|nr:hypothetical protein [Pontixanthobacter gangjinensis]MXO57383.1 hypothetical protein [Pontixanthobacter gangjinensis]